MTWKQIEQSREIRLWFGQIIVPATVAVVTIMAVPEVRNSVSSKIGKVKQSIKNKFKKIEP